MSSNTATIIVLGVIALGCVIALVVGFKAIRKDKAKREEESPGKVRDDLPFEAVDFLRKKREAEPEGDAPTINVIDGKSPRRSYNGDEDDSL